MRHCLRGGHVGTSRLRDSNAKQDLFQT